MTHPTGNRLVEDGGAARRTRSLSREELQRYSRHLALPEVGPEGQRRLKAAKVLCVGVGGLGSPAALYLAAAGVGTIGLVDFDAVDVTNLQRQIVHDTPSIGRPKLESGAARLRALNPHVRIERHDTRVSAANALALVGGYDVVVDGTDNFAARYLVNDACVLSRVPNAYGSIFRFEGQASVFAAPGGPCYRCLHPEPPPPGLVPSCADAGVLGVLPGVIGTIQATEALKLILGIGEPLVGRFLVYDALRLRFRELALRRDPDCPVCGDHPTIRTPVEYEEYCQPDAPQPLTIPAGVPFDISPGDLKARLDAGDGVIVLDVREPYELSICRIEGARSIPLGELPHRVHELPRDTDLVVVCHVGPRSASAVTFLRGQGFPRARNLRGGILAWIDEVEPGQPKY
jgi:molybdopterin/thiamine biosynthesis adenylyltransferase/rhodanese-related sulfurtransferase